MALIHFDDLTDADVAEFHATFPRAEQFLISRSLRGELRRLRQMRWPLRSAFDNLRIAELEAMFDLRPTDCP
jgi:hypothetical protein